MVRVRDLLAQAYDTSLGFGVLGLGVWRVFYKDPKP